MNFNTISLTVIIFLLAAIVVLLFVNSGGNEVGRYQVVRYDTSFQQLNNVHYTVYHVLDTATGEILYYASQSHGDKEATRQLYQFGGNKPPRFRF
jgi:hypothetical protein